MRRCATSERTMTPAKTSTGLVQVIPRLAGKHDHRARVVSATLTSCDGASATPCRWRVQKCKLDNKSQLKGRMTVLRVFSELIRLLHGCLRHMAQKYNQT